jgi:hypothetical protein
MDDLPRQKLRAFLSAHGRAVCDDAERMSQLLAETCPDHPREVEILSQALDELLADDALVSLGERPWKAIANQLTNELMDRHSLSEKEAEWAATSWGIALGEISPDQPGSQLPPLPASRSEEIISNSLFLSADAASGKSPIHRIPERWNEAPLALNTPELRVSRLPGMQMKTVVLMVIAIVAGLIASAMTSRLIDNRQKASLFLNQPASYWSQKLQEPIQRKEVWQGHLKVLKDVDPASALRRGDPEAVPVLIELLKDENSVVRQEAILILARIGGPAKEAIPALQQALNDPDEQVRARAVTALRQFEPAAAGESAGR